MFEHIFRIVIAKISILTLNRINATEPFHSLEKLDVYLALFYMKYNEVRLHGSLAGLSPKTFWQQWELGNIKRIGIPQGKCRNLRGNDSLFK